MKVSFKEPIVKFLFKGLTLYLFWFFIYQWWVHPLEWIDKAIIKNTLSFSKLMLERMGYPVALSGDRFIQIDGTSGLFMGDSCNGISLFALFSIFIIAFPGKGYVKLFFIPIGILLIHVLNIFRVIALAIIETYSYKWTEFNHTYTFTTLMYAFIFGGWVLWINKFSGIKK